jgi:hypothetical protein
MIDSYSFGRIVIKGQSYNSDVIIYPEKVNSSWWRKEGHNLCLEDIKDIINYKPDALVIGKGKPGLMKVPKHVQKAIQNRGITLYIADTAKAVKKYNELYNKTKVVAALHLTC